MIMLPDEQDSCEQENEYSKLLTWNIRDTQGNLYTIKGTSIDVSDGNVVTVVNGVQQVAKFCGYVSLVLVAEK